MRYVTFHNRLLRWLGLVSFVVGCRTLGQPTLEIWQLELPCRAAAAGAAAVFVVWVESWDVQLGVVWWMSKVQAGLCACFGARLRTPCAVADACC
jgi:hypothetical protein